MYPAAHGLSLFGASVPRFETIRVPFPAEAANGEHFSYIFENSIEHHSIDIFVSKLLLTYIRSYVVKKNISFLTLLYLHIDCALQIKISEF